MRAFVTGSSGFVGRHLVKKMLSIGYVVKVLVRPETNISVLKDFDVEFIHGSFNDRTTYETSLNDVDVVVNLAGVVTDWAPLEKYYEVHVKGLEQLLQAISLRNNIKKFIHISTVDVLEKNNKDVPLTDSTRITKSSIPYDRTKAIGEQLVLKYATNSSTEATVIRPAWVYGIGDTTLFPEIAYQIKKRQMVLVRNKNVRIPLVNVENLCDAILLAIEKKGINRQTFLISDGDITWKALCDLIADSVGGKKPSIVIPYTIAFWLGYLMELIGRAIGMKKRPLLTRTAVEMLGVSIRIDASKAEKILGYKPRISFEDGIKQTLFWLKSSNIDSIRVK